MRANVFVADFDGVRRKSVQYLDEKRDFSLAEVYSDGANAFAAATWKPCAAAGEYNAALR